MSRINLSDNEARDLQLLTGRYGVQRRINGADSPMTHPVISVDCAGVDKIQHLPPPRPGLFFHVMNVGIAGNILVQQDNDEFLCLVEPNGLAIIVCDGNVWRVANTDLSGGGGVFIHEPGTAPAVIRTTQSRLRDTVHLFDFIPPEFHHQIESGLLEDASHNPQAAYDAAPALRAAIDQFSYNDLITLVGGPAILLPPGIVRLDTAISINKTVRLTGNNGSGAGNRGERTLLQWPIGVSGFYIHPAGVTLDPASNYTKLILDPLAPSGESSIFESFAMETPEIVPDRYVSPNTNNAFTINSRCLIRDVRIRQWGGDGYHIFGGGSASLPLEVRGNCNNFLIEGGRVTGCRNGLWIDGSDANSGRVEHVDFSVCREWGIVDQSFLGNTYFGVHTAGHAVCGRRGNDHGAFVCIDSIRGQTEPPSFDNPEVWWFAGDDLLGSRPGYISWIPNDPNLRAGGAWAMLDGGSVITSSYAEDGDPVILLSAVAYDPGFGLHDIGEGKIGPNSLYHSPVSIRQMFQKKDGRGTNFYMNLFGKTNVPSAADDLWTLDHDVLTPAVSVHLLDHHNGGIKCRSTSSDLFRTWLETLEKTTVKFGRPEPVPYAMYFDRLFLGPSGNMRPVTDISWKPGETIALGTSRLGHEKDPYTCIQAGVTYAGPSGTAAPPATQLDGTVTWQYVASSDVTAKWEPEATLVCGLQRVADHTGGPTSVVPGVDIPEGGGSTVIWRYFVALGDIASLFTPWAPNEVVNVGQKRVTSTAGYICTVAGRTSGHVYEVVGGTSASSGVGPVGPGTSIADGSVLWNSIPAATAWTQNFTAPYATVRTNGGNTYIVVPGISAASGGPSGTATTGILDGTVHWGRETSPPAYAPWAVNTYYESGDTVVYGGNSYVCVNPGSSSNGPQSIAAAPTAIKEGSVTWNYVPWKETTTGGLPDVDGVPPYANWAPSTAYAVGNRIKNPYNTSITNPSGRVYECVVSGTSSGPPTLLGGDVIEGQTLPNDVSLIWNCIKPVPNWQATRRYVVGDRVTNAGNIYVCKHGVTANVALAGPTGTGTNILDGTAAWDYVGAWATSTQYRTRQVVRGSDGTLYSALPGTTKSGPTGRGDIVDGTTAWRYELPQPMWAASTAYLTGARVSNDGGKVYICISNGTSAASGGPTGTAAGSIVDGSTVWRFLVGSGIAWAASTIYSEGMLRVSDSGKIYRCAKDGTSGTVAPTGFGYIDDGTVRWAYAPSDDSGRMVSSRALKPTGHNWGRGDFIFNSEAAPGQPLAWRCLAEGQPSATGIAAIDAQFQTVQDLTSFQEITTDAAFTLNGLSAPYHTVVSATLTAARTITLNTTGSIQPGTSYRITRTGGGDFNLTVGVSVAVLGQGDWCIVVFDGALWSLAARGRLSPDPGQQDITATSGTVTLLPTLTPREVRFTGTLTANVTVSLSSASVFKGCNFKIMRTGGNTGTSYFYLIIGTSLTFLAQNEYCEVVYDGAAWYVARRGRVVHDGPVQVIDALGATVTLTPFSSPPKLLLTGVLAAARAVTLSTTNAYLGLTFRVTHAATGFNVTVGPGALKALIPGSWGDFTYNGSAWYLAAYGTL